jgi:hypothetical protein
VLVRRLLPLLALSTLLVAGCGGSSDQDRATGTTAVSKLPATKEIIGPWDGKLTQAGMAPFRIGAIIGQDGHGLVGYTGIDCTGHWTLHDSKPPSYVFTEQINHGSGGKCKGTGTVELRQMPGGTLRYRFTGGGVTSSGLLAPASFRAVATIWNQAGLHTEAASIADKLPK